MDVLIVTESCFGLTAAVAEAVAAGLRSRGVAVTCVDASTAPAVDGKDLVVIGAPTHMLGLPKAASRQAAHDKGGREPVPGVQEWLDGLPKGAIGQAAVFDTAVASLFSGSAAKVVGKRLAKEGTTVAGRQSFVVAGQPGPLADGELAKAERWGAELARLRREEV